MMKNWLRVCKSKKEDNLILVGSTAVVAAVAAAAAAAAVAAVPQTPTILIILE
jgi:hypothetical protein